MEIVRARINRHLPVSIIPLERAFSILSNVGLRDSDPFLGGREGLFFNFPGDWGESGVGPFIIISSASTASSEYPLCKPI